MHIETLAVHAGRRADPATGAIAPPIYLSTTFERSRDGEYPLGFSYSRDGNPNRMRLEECLAALEGGREALAFSSGMAAANAVIPVSYTHLDVYKRQVHLPAPASAGPK